MRPWTTGVAVLVATFVSAGCDGSNSGGQSRQSEVYVAAVRDVLHEQPPPPDADVDPVIYIVAGGESDIPADVQADVVGDLHDDADIRFADERSDTLLVEEDMRPVRDEGVLLVIGEVPPQGDPIDVDVETYRSEVDWSRFVFTLAGDTSQWTVTSTTVVLSNNP